MERRLATAVLQVGSNSERRRGAASSLETVLKRRRAAAMQQVAVALAGGEKQLWSAAMPQPRLENTFWDCVLKNKR